MSIMCRAVEFLFDSRMLCMRDFGLRQMYDDVNISHFTEKRNFLCGLSVKPALLIKFAFVSIDYYHVHYP